MLGRWAAADASITCAWKILLKSSCLQGQGALPARDSGWIQTLLASGPTCRPCPSLHKPRRASHKPRRALNKPRRAWIWFWIPLPILSVSFSKICATCWSFSHVCLCPRFFQTHNNSATQRQFQQHASMFRSKNISLMPKILRCNMSTIRSSLRTMSLVRSLLRLGNLIQSAARAANTTTVSSRFLETPLMPMLTCTTTISTTRYMKM